MAAVGFQRWLTGADRGSRVPPRRIWVAITVAVVVLLALGFMSGVLVSADESESAGTAAEGSASSAEPTKPPSQGLPPLIGRADVTVTNERTQRVFAFLKVGDRYYPRQPCVLVDKLWQCVGTDVPRSDVDIPTRLVAIAVPVGEVEELLVKSWGDQPTERAPEWGKEVPVT
ncbi:hypothetical protein [Actinophytocola oryzae]|uniref:Uncharacterized protein n=1 Tax=Actinophytocola oryzae TaxID=502181 RepID=A0A4R7UZ22_9PSEU|nr:hypothetical protein [Actinophytocola oryzae]TDV40336.1 hypothetical protein CLV71_12346 [Actinophytocola oryzae]